MLCATATEEGSASLLDSAAALVLDTVLLLGAIGLGLVGLAAVGVLNIKVQHKMSKAGGLIGSGLTGVYVLAVNEIWYRLAYILTDW